MSEIRVQAQERGGKRLTGSLDISTLLSRVTEMLPVEKVFFEVEGPTGEIQLKEGGHLMVDFVPLSPPALVTSGSSGGGEGELHKPSSPVSSSDEWQQVESTIAEFDPIPHPSSLEAQGQHPEFHYPGGTIVVDKIVPAQPGTKVKSFFRSFLSK